MLNGFIKKVQNIMRVDAGINGDAQRIEQMTWILFLKVYDTKELDWEFHDPNFVSIIPERLRWRNWAIDKKDGESITGNELLEFVNNQLFPALKSIEIQADMPISQRIVKAVFEDTNQYMKDGIQLRKILNIINDIKFEDYKERHAFGEIYETILRDLQSAGNAGEFYTPRAVTDFMVHVINPNLGETIADFACGTGGFLTSSLKELNKQVKTVEDKNIYNMSVYGIEKKPLPYLLAITNMLIHDIDSPQIIHDNSLERDVRSYSDNEKFDIILMNPPYGGTENEIIPSNFPVDYRSSETADLFMVLLNYRLKKNGRAAVILPDGFLTGDSSYKIAIKKMLLQNLNLHLIVKLPTGVFSPYANNVKTNILFFEKGITENIWFFEHPLPKGYLKYTKTRPIQIEEFNLEKQWLLDKRITNFSWQVSIEEIEQNNYNLDFRNPNKDEVFIESPKIIKKRVLETLNEINQYIQKLDVSDYE